MRLICIQVAVKTYFSKPKCHNLHKYSPITVVSVQRSAQTSFRILLWTRTMVAGVKFNKHDLAVILKVDFSKWPLKENFVP